MSLYIATGGERLASLNNIQILGVNVVVLGEIVVLLCDENTLTEEVLVDLLSVCLWNEPVLVLVTLVNGKGLELYILAVA